MPKLSLGGSAWDEIRQAIQAGKEVTFHEKSINAFGWSGMGYSIIDPDTGGGSYLIEGKGNGSYLAGVYLGLAITSYMMAMLTASTGIGGTVFIGLFAGFMIDMEIVLFSMAKNKQKFDKNCFFSELLHGLAPLAFLGFPAKSVELTVVAILGSLGVVDAVADLGGARQGCLQ